MKVGDERYGDGRWGYWRWGDVEMRWDIGGVEVRGGGDGEIRYWKDWRCWVER